MQDFGLLCEVINNGRIGAEFIRGPDFSIGKLPFNQFLWALAISLCLIVVGCGGSNNRTSSATSAISSVSVACAPSTIATSATSQCNATVEGTGNYSSAVRSEEHTSELQSR